MRIGLITDTHLPSTRTRLWDEVHAAFAGVDLIWHGGDIVQLSVLDELEELAPTRAVKGNHDHGLVDARLAHTQWLDVDGIRLAMVHDIEPEDDPVDEIRRFHLGGRHADVIVSGHTHYERLEHRDGVLFVNSGSATHPHWTSLRLGTVGILEVGPAGVRAEIVRLGELDGLRNPGVAMHFDGTSVHRGAAG